MIRQVQSQSPVIVSSQHHTEDFSAYETKILETKDTKASLALASLGAKKKVAALIEDMLQKHKTLKLYFPAFHPWNLLFLRVAKEKRIETTITIHDYHTHAGEKSVLTENIQKKSIKLADQIIFLSNHVKSQAEADLGKAKKFKVSHHPLLPVNNINQLSHSPQLKLLLLGRILKYKGVELILEAIKGLDVNLTIAGVHQNQIVIDSPKTTILNKNLTEAHISDLLATHHVLVLPYLSASQSGVLTLGISAGIPMIITTVGGLPEQLAPEAALWIEPEVQSLRSAILTMTEDSDLYQNLKTALKKARKSSHQSLVL